VRDVFNGCRSVFKATDKDSDGRIALSEFQESAPALQLHLSTSVLESIYHEADMNNDRTIDFREFVVLLVLVRLLRSEEEGAKGPAAGGIDKAVDTLVAAFRFFDKDNSGSIDREEVFAALDSDDVSSSRAKHHSAPRHGAGEAASRQRFQEMDFSKDGKVTFPEFVLAVETWAGVDEE
jgi:calcium-binding protein CML